VTIVKTNKLTWFQNDGEPLKNGYIYVGDPNQDPRSFPKTVNFRDSQGNVTVAAQPLRTNTDGRIDFNGQGVIAEVTGDYSLRVENSSQQLINGGYTPFVADESSSATTDLTDYRQYKLTLSEVKALNLAPGQTVGSIGKTSSQDSEGADWLVVNNTGNPADDNTLIDFSNGNQGVRITNTTQPAVSGFVGASTVFVREDGDQSPFFDVSGTLPATTFESIGPTGSGAANIWTQLDALPSNTKFVEISVRCFGANAGAGSAVTTFNARKTGTSVVASQALTAQSSIITAAASISQHVTWTTIKIPVDGSVRFDGYWQPVSGTTNSVQIYLNGYGA